MLEMMCPFCLCVSKFEVAPQHLEMAVAGDGVCFWCL